MRAILRTFSVGMVGYLMTALATLLFLYGHVVPFRSYTYVFAPAGWLPITTYIGLIPLGLAVATGSAVLDAGRRATWLAHRLDYFFVLVGAAVTAPVAAAFLEWERDTAAAHVLTWGFLIALGAYCWETTVVRLRAKTLLSTTCWQRVFATLPLRQFSGTFILLAVVAASGVLVMGLANSVDAAAARTLYAPISIDYWLMDSWMPGVLAPSVVLAMVAIMGLNIVSVTAERERAIEAQLSEERFRAELITNVTHDLRTPLTSIINYADLIGRYPTTDPTLSEYSAVLGRKAERLRVLIGDVLDASRVSAGAVKVAPEPIELTEILGQLSGDFDAPLANRELTWVFTPSAPCLVITDGALLWRILENLVGNVVKHAQPCTEVQVDVIRLPQHGVIQLRNQLAAPLEVAPEALTEQFVRGDQARHGEGSGLGLFIADRLARVMGASLRVHTDGNSFIATVTLPLAVQPSLTAPPSADQTQLNWLAPVDATPELTSS